MPPPEAAADAQRSSKHAGLSVLRSAPRSAACSAATSSTRKRQARARRRGSPMRRATRAELAALVRGSLTAQGCQLARLRQLIFTWLGLGLELGLGLG